RMSVLSREEEISIMRLVGATESFIRTPMLIEGAFLGLLASGLTLLVLFGLWWPVHRGLGGISPLLVDLARLGFFSARSMLFLGLVGTVTGALGALWGFWTTQRAQRKAEALMELDAL
ncbi:MAG TPA: FtsX-like permease family protein, partial [Holophaga sp.]|nr:FtsX-like permease family protein [Holophaga sp.]